MTSQRLQIGSGTASCPAPPSTLPGTRGQLGAGLDLIVPR